MAAISTRVGSAALVSTGASGVAAGASAKAATTGATSGVAMTSTTGAASIFSATGVVSICRFLMSTALKAENIPAGFAAGEETTEIS